MDDRIIRLLEKANAMEGIDTALIDALVAGLSLPGFLDGLGSTFTPGGRYGFKGLTGFKGFKGLNFPYCIN
jgi:hypothetical protein